MARNGSGTYSNPYPDFVAGTTISSTEVDANNSDIATALTQSIAVDGQSTVTANIPMATYKFTGVGAGSAATDSANLGQIQAEGYIWCGTMTGTADAGVLTPSPAITAYAAGQRFAWKASANVNTGAMTIAISGLTTIAAQNDRAALVAGDHAADDIYMGILDTTSTIQIMKFSGASGNVVGPASATDNSLAKFDGTTGKLLKDGAVIGTDVLAPNGDGSALTGIATQGKNLIINGDMRIAQRGTSFAGASSGDYSLDRWAYNHVGASVVTVTQDTSVPDNAFSRSFKVDVTTADASIAAGDLALINQKIEGLNCIGLAQGTANAKTIAASFRVSSPKAGIHCVAIRNSALDRNYITEYTVAVADTWETKTVIIALDQSGTWLETNGNGLDLGFALAAGSTYQGAADTWQAGNLFATANQVNCLDNTANNFLITGVQLEVGSVATAYEQRLFGTELALCQRYYETTSEVLAYIDSGTATSAKIAWYFKTKKRAAPTIALAASFSSSDMNANAAGGTTSSSSPVATVDGTNKGSFAILGAGFTANKTYRLAGSPVCTASSEL